jgi:hypothetical protein
VEWFGVLVVVALIAATLIGLPLLAHRVRRGETGGSSFDVFEDMWHPAGRRARLEVEVQQERPATAPAPGDRLF